jgi:hypothetical protein
MRAVVSRQLVPRPPHHARKAWLVLLDTARTLAGTANGTRYAAHRTNATWPDRIADFRHLLKGVRASDFPVGDASAVLLVEALIKASAAFCTAGTPERRTDFAAPLEALARAAEALLDEQRSAEARAAWMDRSGEN